MIVSIEEPALLARILAHRRERGQEDAPVASLGPRAPQGTAQLAGAIAARSAGVLAAAPPCTVRRYTRRQQKGFLFVLSAGVAVPSRFKPLHVEVLVVGAAEVGDAAAGLHLDHTSGEAADELAVVRDENQRAGILLEADLQ